MMNPGQYTNGMQVKISLLGSVVLHHFDTEALT
jgi:hypothetical protein